MQAPKDLEQGQPYWQLWVDRGSGFQPDFYSRFHSEVAKRQRDMAKWHSDFRFDIKEYTAASA